MLLSISLCILSHFEHFLCLISLFNLPPEEDIGRLICRAELLDDTVLNVITLRDGWYQIRRAGEMIRCDFYEENSNYSSWSGCQSTERGREMTSWHTVIRSKWRYKARGNVMKTLWPSCQTSAAAVSSFCLHSVHFLLIIKHPFPWQRTSSLACTHSTSSPHCEVDSGAEFVLWSA